MPFLLLSALALAAPAPRPVPRQSLPLHVMSYNIKGLPSVIVGSGYSSERFAVIGKLLAERAKKKDAPAIVLLQEAFSSDTNRLIQAAGYPHVSRGPGYGSLLGLDSGLYILSQYPVAASAQKAFPPGACERWDCFANKGMQFARIDVPGLPLPLEVFNTHLQAGRSDPPSRAIQVKALLEFYKEHHVEGNPVIFGGDFNLRPLRNSATFNEFVSGTGLHHSGKVCLDRGCARSPDTGWQGIWENAVDHQFFSAQGTVEIVPTSIERTYSEPVNGLRLSDHAAHEVRFDLRFVPLPATAGKPICEAHQKC